MFMFLPLFISWNRGREQIHTENTLISTLAPLVLEVDGHKGPSLGQEQKIWKGLQLVNGISTSV